MFGNNLPQVILICYKLFPDRRLCPTALNIDLALRKLAHAINRDFLSFKNGKVLIFFLFLLQNIDCWYSLEPPRRGGSNEYRLAEAVLTSTHNLCFGAKIRTRGPMVL